MNKKAFKKGLEQLGFNVEVLPTTGMTYATISLCPIPYRDETDTKIIPFTIVVCDMGGVDKGNDLGCVTCNVRATVKRPYARFWDTNGSIHNFAFVDGVNIDTIGKVKEWLAEYQACKKDWEIVK